MFGRNSAAAKFNLHSSCMACTLPNICCAPGPCCLPRCHHRACRPAGGSVDGGSSATTVVVVLVVCCVVQWCCCCSDVLSSILLCSWPLLCCCGCLQASLADNLLAANVPPQQQCCCLQRRPELYCAEPLLLCCCVAAQASLTDNLLQANASPQQQSRLALLGNSFASYQARWAAPHAGSRPSSVRPDRLLALVEAGGCCAACHAAAYCVVLSCIVLRCLVLWVCWLLWTAPLHSTGRLHRKHPLTKLPAVRHVCAAMSVPTCFSCMWLQEPCLSWLCPTMATPWPQPSMT
jgi:hypothetical protein